MNNENHVRSPVLSFDMLKPIEVLVSLVTKWDEACDTALHKLICYMEDSKDCILLQLHVN